MWSKNFNYQILILMLGGKKKNPILNFNLQVFYYSPYESKNIKYLYFILFSLNSQLPTFQFSLHLLIK